MIGRDMSVRINFLAAEGYKEWDEFVLRSQNGTFFHLTGWKDVVRKTFGFEPKYLVARVPDRIRGILPLFRVPLLPFGECLISVPFAVYGGICAEDAEISQQLLDASVELLSRSGGKYIELRHVKGIELSLVKKDLYSTFRRPIFSTVEANMAAIPRKQRAEIRNGQKNGLASKIGGEEFLEGFYDIYAHSVRNLGSPVFPKSLFRNLLEIFGEQCKIMTVWHQGRMVSGVMAFFFRDQVMPYYGGSLKECFSLSVNDLMYWDLMCYALGAGYKVFDFGRSKKGTGSYRYKEHWGFQAEALEYQYYMTGGMEMPNVSPSNPMYATAISIWKKMPLPLTKIIGPALSRFFP